MNTPIHSDPQQQQDRALLDEAQRLLVKKIIQQSSDEREMSDTRMRIYTSAIATFQKIALSRDRLVAYERRTDAHYHIAQGRNDTQLEIARLRAEAASARRRPDHPQKDEDDPLAPFGRKKDGTPYTEAEFDQSLNEAIRGIWGLKPVNPKSYMPWEMKRAPDGKLVPPDDPAVASGAPAGRRPPDGDTREPPDIADSAPLRARSATDGSDAGARIPSRTHPDGNPFLSTPTEIEVKDNKSPGRMLEAERGEKGLSYQQEGSHSRGPFVTRNSSFVITTGSSSSRSETAPTQYPSEDG